MEKTPILLKDKKFVELFEHCAELYKEWAVYDIEQQGVINELGTQYVDGYIEGDKLDLEKSKKHDEYLDAFCAFMDKLGKTSKASAERAVEVLGENPSFETIESNLMAEIKYSEIPLFDSDYKFLAKHVDQFAASEEKIIAMQRGRSCEYPNLEVVKKGLEARGLKEIINQIDAIDVMYYHIDYEKAMSPETQALVDIINRYVYATLEKTASQPGEKE